MSYFNKEQELSEINLERRMKKAIHSSRHKAIVTPSPGLLDVSLREIAEVFAHRIPRDSSDLPPSLEVIEGEIVVGGISFREMIELPYRLLTVQNIWWQLTDFRAQGVEELKKGLGRVVFNYYLPNDCEVALKVDSVSSRLFHESMIKELLAKEIVKVKGVKISHIKEANFHLWLQLNDNRAKLYLSLATQPLYVRGYRRSFDTPAPLREDVAAALIQQFIFWAGECIKRPFHMDAVYVPFAGSGTLAFETISTCLKLPSGLWGRKYGMERFPCFTTSHFNYLKKKFTELVAQTDGDSSPALPKIRLVDRLEERVEEICQNRDGFFSPLFFNKGDVEEHITIMKGDFFKEEEQPWLSWGGGLAQTLFIPLNPPYGIRLKKAGSDYSDYQRISRKLVAIKQANPHLMVGGFILAANEEAWRAVKENLTGFRHKSFHITLGGRDLRVVNFLSQIKRTASSRGPE